MPLMTYFGFVDEGGEVDVKELCALVKTVQAAKTPAKASGKDAALSRLRTLLVKAKDQGVDLKKSFAHFDANGDGEITRGELKAGLVALGCFKEMADGDFDSLLEQIDDDGSGKIDFTEFRALVSEGSERTTPSSEEDKKELMAKLKTLMEKAVEKGVSIDACFAHFDKDGDGMIRKEEFVTAMTELGLGADSSVINGVIKLLDRNGNGTISLSEFKQLFPAISAPAPEASATKPNADDKTPDAAAPVPVNKTSPREDEKENASVSRAPSARQTTEEKLRRLLLCAEAGGVDVKKCFAHFDSDSSGVITRDEFVDAIKQLPGFETVPDEDTLAIVKTLDKDASGSVSLEEFDAFLRTTPTSTAVEGTAGKQEHENAVESADTATDSPPLTGHEDTSDAASTTAGAVDTSEPGDATVKTPETAVSAPENASSTKEVQDSTEEDAFPSEGGDGSVPVPTELPSSDDVKEPEAVKAKQSPREEANAKSADSAPADESPSAPTKPSEEGESTAPAGDSEAPGKTEPTPVESKQPKQPVRSSSFGKGKNPDATAAAATGAPFRRTQTDPKAVGATEKEWPTNSKPTPLRVSFAAARAAKRAEMAAPKTPKPEDSASEAATLSKPASEGLAKLKKLLHTATEKGVAVQQSFNHFDKEAKGVLPYDQFVTGLRELGPDFANLSDDDIIAMAKSLDCKQQNALRVEDFVSFVEAPAVENAPAVAEKPVKSEDQTSSAPPDTQAAPVVTSKRPPPLRRSGSSRLPAKKPPRPSTGTQSARAVTETTGSTSVVVQDKPWKAKPAGATDTVETAAEPGPVPAPASGKAEQATKPDAVVKAPSQGPTPQDQSGGAANLDCNYAFSSNPEIRAVELKLRQTALDAYQRGILPLRVVSKFLEDADDRRGRVPGGRERSSKKRSELLRVEFLQVLMELGFTLLSDQSEDDVEAGAGGGMAKPVTKMNDHLYARQLERLARYRQHVKSDEAKAHKQLVRAVSKTKQYQQRGRQQGEDSLRRFQEEKNQLLRVLSYYRDGHKKSLVYSLLRQQVTTSLTLFPSFGDLLFFELPFVNPYSHNDRFRIELLLPSSREIAVVLDLEIVRSSEEWAFYRENLPLAYGFAASSAEVEEEMIDDHNEVVMDLHDQLHVPMRLRWLDTSDSFTRVQKTEKKSAIPVSVVIKSCSHGHTVALFNMELRPQPFACHRVLRFSHPASSIWRWKLRYPRGKFVVCMDPSVAMELLRSGEDEANNSGLASFKCRVGEYPALETFFVVLYDDKYYARVFEVWQIRIQSKLRVDVHAVLGQSVRHELVIKGDGGLSTQDAGAKRRVMCFTPMQHRSLVQFRPGQVFALVPQAFNRIEFAFCAVENAAATHLVVLVNLVDVDTHELVGAWSVHVTLALPVITKTYELRLPVGRAAQKKISYSNPWDQPQTIVLRSSAPTLLVPREPVLQLPSNGQDFLRLAFAARDYSAAASEDIYLFINDKRTDQNEECLLFQVTYE